MPFLLLATNCHKLTINVSSVIFDSCYHTNNFYFASDCFNMKYGKLHSQYIMSLWGKVFLRRQLVWRKCQITKKNNS